MKKSWMFAALAAVVALAGGLSTAIAAPTLDANLQASGTIAVSDTRVAALWRANPDGTQLGRECTAAYVGDGLWLTASHCFGDMARDLAYVEASGVGKLPVKRVHQLAATSDAVVLETDAALAERFQISATPLPLGQEAVLWGISRGRTSATEADLRVEEFLGTWAVQGRTFSDVYRSVSTTDSLTCPGDSGAPVMVGDVVYAIHTAGANNQSCVDGEGYSMWHSDVSRYRYEIDALQAQENPLDLQELARVAATNRLIRGGEQPAETSTTSSALSS